MFLHICISLARGPLKSIYTVLFLFEFIFQVKWENDFWWPLVVTTDILREFQNITSGLEFHKLRNGGNFNFRFENLLISGQWITLIISGRRRNRRQIFYMSDHIVWRAWSDDGLCTLMPATRPYFGVWAKNILSFF